MNFYLRKILDKVGKKIFHIPGDFDAHKTLKRVFDIKETYFSEIDKYAVDVYKYNFKNSKYPFWGVKSGKNNSIKGTVKKIKEGDILWFFTLQ